MTAKLNDFFETEIGDEFAKSSYLLLVSDVLTGQHNSNELSGNAYHLRVTTTHVYIESIWDEEAKTEIVPTRDFFELLTALPI
jgi:hypothetical protein